MLMKSIWRNGKKIFHFLCLVSTNTKYKCTLYQYKQKCISIIHLIHNVLCIVLYDCIVKYSVQQKSISKISFVLNRLQLLQSVNIFIESLYTLFHHYLVVYFSLLYLCYHIYYTSTKQFSVIPLLFSCFFLLRNLPYQRKCCFAMFCRESFNFIFSFSFFASMDKKENTIEVFVCVRELER